MTEVRTPTGFRLTIQTALKRTVFVPLPMKDEIRRIFEASIQVKQHFLLDQLPALIAATETVIATLRRGGKVLLFGNGGSAADAQHIAAEFVNRYVRDRPPLPAIALTTDTSALTAIANDFGPEEVFVKQIRALGKAGDVALAISTSGNSPNVLRGIECCRELKIKTIGLTGGTGGVLAKCVDHCLCVAATTSTPRIQETHILIGHAICETVDFALYGPDEA